MFNRIDGQRIMEVNKPIKKLGPFDFISSICEGSRGKNLFSDPTTEEKSYVPFVVNRALSYHGDAVLLANEANRRHQLSPRMQYDFLRHSLRPRKRFSKWLKNEDSDAVLLIKKAYGYSSEKARQVAPLFNSQKLQQLARAIDVGGKA